MVDRTFWKNRKVFLTGHTGFKGSWLCLWLNYLGATVTGFALDPPTEPSLFEICNIGRFITSVNGDIRNRKNLNSALFRSSPEIVIHMAAQPLVRESYLKPAETYEVNVIGTVNLLESVRNCKGIKAVINITSDKCYDNKEWLWGYREDDALGGYDPYSNSKACAELITSSYRNSFFNPAEYRVHGIGLASARSGNVIGGGDWGADRLLPDCVRALLKGEKIIVRNPDSVRPWQHVLEPLAGYLLLAQRLYENGAGHAEAWNFGPDDVDIKPVEWLVRKICEKWGQGASYKIDKGRHPHEAHYLKLDCSKAKTLLGWYPRWNLDIAIDKVVEWTRAYKGRRDVRKLCLKQIQEYGGS
jgi:CDP-glucose 4,6-dehydratase